MEAVFIKLVNMSISASYMVIIIALLRLMLKKAPKWIWGILWAMVAIRLLIPFSMESVLSLMPTGEPVSPEVFQVSAPVLPADRPVAEPIPVGTSPVWPGELEKPSMTPVTKPVAVPEQPVEESTEVRIGWIAAVVWAVGLSGMLLYALISYLRVRHKVREGVPFKDNCYLCDHIGTPFILGIIRPRIYLPSDMDEGDHDYVISHEMAHLKRKDHWWKPFGFLLLSVYWFNPVIWLGYILLCRDIELACDERVIKELGSEQKKPYADALINCSISRRFISACPLAFGEGNVERRIKSVLNYKKPAFWVILLSIVVCIAVAATMLTDPITEKEGERTNQEDVSAPKEGEERILFDLVNEIANNPDAAMHSNPYRYIEMKQDAYDEILDYGDTAVEYFVAYLREADNYGLQEYIMAAACSEITGIGQKTNGSGWATAGEWLAIYESVLSVPDNQTSNSMEKFITVDGVDISIDEINSQIKSTFNKDLFYGGFYTDSKDITLNAELILNKTLEYDLYYNPDQYTQLTPKIYIVITNLTHHRSTAEEPLLYMFGIDVTKHGLRSDFSRMGAVSKSSAIELDNPFSLYMGSYSMCINEITQPTHEKMSDEWKRKAESAIQLYMDNNVTHAINKNDLAPGKYTVYIEGFSKSDSDSTVVFVHEDGRVYMAEYLSLHEIYDGELANLNRLYLVEWAEKETFQMYLSRLRANPALEMEYCVDAVEEDLFAPGVKKSLIDTFTVEKNGNQYTYRVYRIKTDTSVEDYVVSADGKEVLELGEKEYNTNFSGLFMVPPYTIIDEIEYDIDGDGIKERAVLYTGHACRGMVANVSFWEGNRLQYTGEQQALGNFAEKALFIDDAGNLTIMAEDWETSEPRPYSVEWLSGHIIIQKKDGAPDTRYLVESSAENQISIEIPIFEDGGAINQTILEYPMQWLYECTGQTFDYGVSEYGLTANDEYAVYLGIVKHRITYVSDDLISIVFEGYLNQKTAAHPVGVFFTLNINRKTGERIWLKDIYTVDEAFYDIFLKYAREQLPQELTQLISVEELFSKDFFLSGMDTEGYWAYFTDTGVGISCPVPHVAGDHMEIEIPYSALQQNRLSNQATGEAGSEKAYATAVNYCSNQPNAELACIDSIVVSKHEKEYWYYVYEVKTDISAENIVVSEDGKEVLELGEIEYNTPYGRLTPMTPYTVVDEIEYDIDGDGIKEWAVLYISYGCYAPAAIISFWEGNKLEYYSSNISEYYDFHFYIGGDGSLDLMGLDSRTSEAQVYDVELLSGSVVLEENGSPLHILPLSVTIIDSVDFDIDDDGFEETCSIGCLSDTGALIYEISITEENGKSKSNLYHYSEIPSGELYFQINEDGDLVVIIEDDSEKHIYHVELLENTVVLTQNGIPVNNTD